jgi:hypothetical protein
MVIVSAATLSLPGELEDLKNAAEPTAELARNVRRSMAPAADFDCFIADPFKIGNLGSWFRK